MPTLRPPETNPIRGIVVMLPLLLGGCFNTWPEYGRGGMAEVRAPELAPDDVERRNLMAELDGEQGRLVQWRLRHADGQGSAHLAEADLLTVRIRREIAGGLPGDARADLRRLAAALERLGPRQTADAGVVR